MTNLSRRELLLGSAMLGAGAARAASPGPVAVGIVGVGSRGAGHVRNLLKLEGVELKAVCDVVPAKVERAQQMAVEAGKPKPDGYSGGESDYKRLCERDDLDLVYNATPWRLHTPVCVETMKNGKHAAVEVPAALTLEECWQLVETAEQTGRYCVMLENCNYGRIELMTLHMTRKNFLGDLVHARCGYLHDLRAGKFRDTAMHRPWRLQHSIRRNADLYPTHGLGPVAQSLNINRGNQFDHIVSMASKSLGLHQFAVKEFGPDSPQAKLEIKLGDVVTSLIHTRAGQTIVVTHDTNLPRPYSRDYLVQGTRGLLRMYPEPKIYIEGKSEPHEWDELPGDYAAEWEHPLWKGLEEEARGGGHGGMDFVMSWRLIDCLRHNEPPDMDVYDAAAVSAVTELSERSISGRSRTVDFPDFTRQRWLEREPLGIVGVRA